MAAKKAMTPEEYFEKNKVKFIKFGEHFVDLLNDEELINAVAEKDLEKLAKVWKLVFEMLIENSPSNSSDKLTELIGAYNVLGKEDDE